MGANGDITMSNLKIATGIADNRLSAHHPDGAGNATAFGDFLVGVVGRRVASSVYVTASAHDAPPAPFDGWDTSISIPNCGDPNGTIVDGTTPSTPRNLTGSIDTANGQFVVDGTERFEKGDTFWVRIDTNADDSLGKYVAEQIGKNTNSLVWQSGSSNLAAPTGNREVGKDADGNYVIDIEMEMTDVGSVGAAMNAPFRYVDGMNTDAANYDDPSTQTGVDNTSLLFVTTDVESDLVYVRQLRASYTNTSGDNYDMQIEAWVHDPADKYGTLYMWSYFDDSSTCPPNGVSTAMTRSGDDQIASRTIFQTLLPDNTYQWRVVISKNDNPSASDLLDAETIDIFVDSNNSTGSNTDSVAAGDYDRTQSLIVC